MAVSANVAEGGTIGVPAVNGPSTYRNAGSVDFAVNNLADGDVIRLINVPTNHKPRQIRAAVSRADSVAGATVDLGLYKVSDNSAVDADGLVNELPVDATGEVQQAPAASNAITEPMFIGVAKGAAGGATTLATGKIDVAVVFDVLG
jgi:hypothetical protein